MKYGSLPCWHAGQYFPLPAQVDYLNEREIILHMRALLDLHDLLLLGYDKEMQKFRIKLFEVGWSKEKITELLHKAAKHTRYEFLISHPIHGFDRDKF